MGAMTGRGAGFCGGYAQPGVSRFGFGAGLGRGRGAGVGRGWRNRYYATGIPGFMRFGGFGGGYATPNQPLDARTEKQELQHEAELLQNQLQAIERRLAEIASASASANSQED
ncbi:DUF5320 domain-containing protein [Desulfatitalea sp. M08but]|uniref:DUF5320 domain-containing protein n=2 Tax=Desulfatitalea alkaliphila TaxID=2929485 RepID=A0AA41R6V6_9BACT|nr:DUF5320 domain-containing protein [Desulfatitalea alkaliphila]